MKKLDFGALPALVCASLLIIGLTIGCSEERANGVQEVTFEQLFLSPDQYSGKDIEIEGYYYQGWETIVLSEELVYSGYAPGHLIPDGKTLWIEKGVPKDIYDSAYQQQMMGPLERYGKVRIKGIFEYGDKYGHVGAFSSQILPSDVELLPWSPPAEG